VIVLIWVLGFWWFWRRFFGLCGEGFCGKLLVFLVELMGMFMAVQEIFL